MSVNTATTTPTLAAIRADLRRRASAQSTKRYCTIKRMSGEQQIVWGAVYEPYVLDTYGEFMLPNDIELMAHRFMQLDLTKVIDTQHDNVANGSYPVESFVAREGDPDFAAGTWVLGVKVPDPVMWHRVKSGQLNGFSFQCMVRMQDVEVEFEVIRDHVGRTERAAEDDHTHVYFVQVNDQGQVTGGHTDEVDGHRHKILRASVTEAEALHSHRFFL